MKNLDRFPRPPPPRNGAFCPLRSFTLDVPIYYAKIAIFNSDVSENNKLNGYTRAFNPLNLHGCLA